MIFHLNWVGKNAHQIDFIITVVFIENIITEILWQWATENPLDGSINRIYPHPINPCAYSYDSICHLQISI